MIFNKSAKYYDAFLKDKYGNCTKKEVEGLIKIINKYKPNSRTILDLACGTGRHSLIFGKKGYSVIGVDKSKKMIDIAMDKDDYSTRPGLDNVLFKVGDMKNFDLNYKSDIVLSLFESLGYVTKQKELEKVLKNINKHLKRGGLFIVDLINGERALKSDTKIKIRTIRTKNECIERKSVPLFNFDKDIITIKQLSTHYFTNNSSGYHIRFLEEHKMRYFFIDEMIKLLENTGFKVLERKDRRNSWAYRLICKKVK